MSVMFACIQYECMLLSMPWVPNIIMLKYNYSKMLLIFTNNVRKLKVEFVTKIMNNMFHSFKLVFNTYVIIINLRTYMSIILIPSVRKADNYHSKNISNQLQMLTCIRMNL